MYLSLYVCCTTLHYTIIYGVYCLIYAHNSYIYYTQLYMFFIELTISYTIHSYSSYIHSHLRLETAVNDILGKLSFLDIHRVCHDSYLLMPNIPILYLYYTYIPILYIYTYIF